MGNICKCRNKCKEYIQNNNLKNATNELPLFSFEGIKCNAKIVNVYDGDTFKAVIYYDNKMIKINCRSLGYDSPEMKPRLNIKNREEHIEKAKAAKNRFIELVSVYELVYLECFKFDKYGRVLVNIYSHKTNYNNSINRELEDKYTINNKMIEERHGYVYNGGKKKL